ncbi:MAG: THUMP domain-containing protein, partial [Candidatus Cloacimonadaceae bacterium]|nr:THUMP domain-containing protein [Candidatus Cloacimonadaceae bacterium]
MEYQETNKYFAQVAGSLENHAAEELSELGAEILMQVPRGLRFSCDKATLYKILYTSRLLQRVLAPLLSFQCHSEKYLYNQAYNNLTWHELFSLNQSFGIDANVSGSKIKHSLYAGQLLKDAICDSFRDKYDKRPDFSTSNADVN